MVKPMVDISYWTGEIFDLLSSARFVLRMTDHPQTDIDDMGRRVFAANSYDKALAIIGEFVEFYPPLTDRINK